MRPIYLAIAALALTSFTVWAASSWRLQGRAVPGGGDPVSGGGYVMFGALAQPGTGSMEGAGYRLSGGAYVPAAPTETANPTATASLVPPPPAATQPASTTPEPTPTNPPGGESTYRYYLPFIASAGLDLFLDATAGPQ